ncbi:MAG: hypothetical protein KF830_15295 [Planctomycetes bacterium]|nr:hypothetical protein [Planctomycetota bacterium]
MAAILAQSFPHSGHRAWPVLSAGISVVAAGLGAVGSGRADITPAGWGAVAIGIGFLVAMLLPLWLRVPVVAFDESGLRARLPGFGTIAWADIERVRIVRLHQRGVALLVVDRHREARRRRRGGYWPRSYARAAGSDDLAVPIDGLTARPDQIVACVQLAHGHALAAPGAPRR